MVKFKDIAQHEFKQDYYKSLHDFVEQEYQTKTVYPPKHEIFRSLNLCEYDQVKVVILGQDPYHGPNQANGLAFSVRKGIAIPPSLVNIFQELHNDLGCSIPRHGDLTDWAKQGVLLLNNVLTVQRGRPNSHGNRGWEQFTLQIVKAMNQRKQPLVFILWGKNAMEKRQYIDTSRHLVLMSPHPSPYSADRGFFGSKPFSQANAFLQQQGMIPIDWQIKDV